MGQSSLPTSAHNARSGARETRTYNTCIKYRKNSAISFLKLSTDINDMCLNFGLLIHQLWVQLIQYQLVSSGFEQTHTDILIQIHVPCTCTFIQSIHSLHAKA